jgi:hypothetical protein
MRRCVTNISRCTRITKIDACAYELGTIPAMNFVVDSDFEKKESSHGQGKI